MLIGKSLNSLLSMIQHIYLHVTACTSYLLDLEMSYFHAASRFVNWGWGLGWGGAEKARTLAPVLHDQHPQLASIRFFSAVRSLVSKQRQVAKTTSIESSNP